MAEASENIVVDVSKWEWSEMWKKEDWWAIWLGFIILIAGMFVYFPYSGDMKEMLNKAEARKIPAGKWLANFTHKTHAWSNNPMDAFFMGKEKAEAKAAAAKVKYAEKKALEKTTFAAALAAETLVEAAGFNNEGLNAKASKAISSWRDAKLFSDKAKKKSRPSPTTRSAV